MKIYVPNKAGDQLSGGFTFLRNFRKGLKERVHFVDSWLDSDVVLISGITMVDPSEIAQAKKFGKKIVLRVDNVPRKSRNRRSSPYQRLKELSALADVVVYQSEWAKNYCYPLCGDGTIIYNGVDQSIFKPDITESEAERENRYLFMYYGKNELKGFWHAHLYFQFIHRKNPNAVFWFVNDFGSETDLLSAANFDFWNGETFMHLPVQQKPEDVADLMQQCKYLIYPAIGDACPNVVLEARACGMTIICHPEMDMAGTRELVNLEDISLERMCQEYLGIFELLIHESSN